MKYYLPVRAGLCESDYLPMRVDERIGVFIFVRTRVFTAGRVALAVT